MSPPAPGSPAARGQGEERGPGATGHPGLRVPQPAKPCRCCGSTGTSWVTAGSWTRPRAQNQGRQTVPVTGVSHDCDRASLKCHSGAFAGKAPSPRTSSPRHCPGILASTAEEGASLSPSCPWETQPELARAPLKRSQRCPGWCPWAGTDRSPSPSFLRRGTGGTRNLFSAARQASGQTSSFSRTS